MKLKINNPPDSLNSLPLDVVSRILRKASLGYSGLQSREIYCGSVDESVDLCRGSGRGLWIYRSLSGPISFLLFFLQTTCQTKINFSVFHFFFNMTKPTISFRVNRAVRPLSCVCGINKKYHYYSDKIQFIDVQQLEKRIYPNSRS